MEDEKTMYIALSWEELQDKNVLNKSNINGAIKIKVIQILSMRYVQDTVV